MAEQPVATRPLFTLDDYTTARGERAFSVRLDIADMAKFYAAAPGVAYPEIDWASCGPNDYVPYRITGAHAALDAVAAFTFPASLKAQAQRAARRLVSLFDAVARLAVARDLTAGRLDMRKLPALARATAAGTYDPNVIRPYRRTQPAPVAPPTVAIVASAGWAEMWADEGYIPRTLTLTLSLLWACEAAGLRAGAAFTQQLAKLSAKCGYAEAMQALVLATPDRPTGLRAYAAALHSDLFRHGYMSALAADPMMFARLKKVKAGCATIGGSWSSFGGGCAAQWARQVWNADIVIGIGAVTDAPDIRLGAHFTLDTAVSQIAQQARKLERHS